MNQLKLSDLIPDRKRVGKNYFSKCPFHKGGEAPALVSKDDEFCCLVCGASGDAAEYMARMCHVTRDEVLRDQGLLPEREKVPERVYHALQEAQEYFEWWLQSKGKYGEEARKYLEGRKISPETQKKFHLGLAPKYGDYLHSRMIESHYTNEELLEGGLIKEDPESGDYLDRFWGRLMIPIHDEFGKVIGFGGRIMDGNKSVAKYMNSPESPVFQKRENLYALDLAKASKQGFLILCEGYMDVISMHQAGFTNAVASLGTALTEEQVNLMKMHVNRVVIMYDSDDAGINAAIKAVKHLRSAGIQTKVCNYSAYGKDPDEVLKTHGRQAMIEILKKSESGTSFLLRHCTANEALDLLLTS